MNKEILIRKASKEDDLNRICELIYDVDPYIYPYWFGTKENCKRILSKLLLEDNFIFNIQTFYLAIDKSNNMIVGIASIVDKYTNLEYDYSKLLHYNDNDNFNYVIKEYIMPMIEKVKENNTACLTNMCVDKKYRNLHIGLNLLDYAINDYINNCKNISDAIEFDVLKDNIPAIKLYKHLGFKQVGNILKGFNGKGLNAPDVIIMKKSLK